MKRYVLELHRRRDLIAYLVTSGLKAQHRNAVLGYLWWLLDPLLGVLIYYFVVAILFGRGGEGYGPYLIVGMVVWRWLGSTIGAASGTIVRQAGIVTQVYLPKIVFPVTEAMTGLVNFGFGLLVVAIIFLAWSIRPGLAVLWLPCIALVQLLFTMALASIVAYVGVFLRDAETMMSHVVRIWFFASPVIWQVDLIPEGARWLLDLNPIAHLLTAYRDVLIGNQGPSPGPLVALGILSLAVLMGMTFIYSRYEHRMIKVL